jgi:hypothetical protein
VHLPRLVGLAQRHVAGIAEPEACGDRGRRHGGLALDVEPRSARGPAPAGAAPAPATPAGTAGRGRQAKTVRPGRHTGPARPARPPRRAVRRPPRPACRSPNGSPHRPAGPARPIIAEAAPRDRASRASAPLPAKRSSTRSPVTPGKSQLNRVSLTRSGEGRRPSTSGTGSGVRFHCPPIIRTLCDRRGSGPGAWTLGDAPAARPDGRPRPGRRRNRDQRAEASPAPTTTVCSCSILTWRANAARTCSRSPARRARSTGPASRAAGCRTR